MQYLQSHPVWVRGLKLFSHRVSVLVDESHPVWVRGLKPLKEKFKKEEKWSHPVWVRGLKHINLYWSVLNLVASRVGAWIETSQEIHC